jgi:hypothetical protein
MRKCGGCCGFGGVRAVYEMSIREDQKKEP